MDLQLSGKLALVTGASKGIGRATAIALAEEGCNLALVSRDLASLNKVAEGITLRFSVSARALAADLSRQDAIERVAAGSSNWMSWSTMLAPFRRVTSSPSTTPPGTLHGI